VCGATGAGGVSPSRGGRSSSWSVDAEWTSRVTGGGAPATAHSRAYPQNPRQRRYAGLASSMQRSPGMTTQRIASLLAMALLFATVADAAAPAEDRILALDRYTSDKGRGLAATYGVTLKQINTSIYHCMPWLE